jgi:hypothetical protein
VVRALGRPTTPSWGASAGALRVELRAVLRVVAASLAGGLLVGLVWWLLTPLPALEKRSAGVFAVGSSPESSIAADGWFAVVGLLAGVVAALLATALLRDSRLGALVGLTLGGLLGSVVAWQFGVLLGPEALDAAAAAAQVGERFTGPLRLSAYGVLLAWPTAAVIAYFAAAAGVESSRPAPAPDPSGAASDGAGP